MLKLDEVHFRYGGRAVLSGFSLEARAGEVLALAGPTGSGKTTALRLLAGLEVPARGRVLLDGQPAAADGRMLIPPERRNVAMVFQRLALWPHLTVGESLEFVMAGRVPADGRAARRRALLDELGIGELDGRKPAELSGGQAALAAVARALAQEPRALLLDEPFSGLDPELRDATRAKVFALVRARGLAAVYVSHLREEVARSADRVVSVAAPTGSAGPG
jgi:ABC-type Fe3+/spermidine/putrescine transport system ATPase subunit